MVMEIQDKLKKLIKETLEELSISDVKEINLEHPAQVSNGDYSTNVAMIGAKNLGKSPRALAEEIVQKLNQIKQKEIEKIEVAGPGFINFFLSKSFFTDATSEILKDKKWGENKKLKGQKIIIEYTQPNPFKEFHIGHLVNNIVGEAVSRIIEVERAKVKRVTYHGDVGLHVAKAIWAMKKNSLNPDSLSDWGKAYAAGDKDYDEDESAKKEITEINKAVYEGGKEFKNLYEKGRSLSLNHFKEIYKRLGSSFDKSFFESETGKIGQKLVEKFLEKGVFEKSEGAVIFSKEKSGLHTRVFISSEGLPTYETKDLGLIEQKRKYFKFDRSITVTDVEQAEYYKVIMKAAEFIFPDLKGKIEHLSHGRLRLTEGRMSSRTGNIISGESLLNDLKNMALSKMEDREIKDKEKIADQIAVAALKYSILKQSPGKNIVFDFEKSLSFEGDSGPYLQYTAVRANSVLEKASELGLKAKVGSAENSQEIKELERMLYKFPEIVETAGANYAPQNITTFLVELAGAFNSFYAKEKIADEKDQDSPYKIALTKAVFITLKKGLNILGIQVPKEM